MSLYEDGSFIRVQKFPVGKMDFGEDLSYLSLSYFG